MANSQGFTLPFTGRLGKLTTGYRAGRYITRVIPDVKPMGVPSDEQVMQRDLFGKVSAFYSSLKSVVELGFASKRGGALNYAIKKNWSQFYLGADFKLEYNFPELSFSEGKMTIFSISSLQIFNTSSGRRIRVFYEEDYGAQRGHNDRVVCLVHIVETGEILTSRAFLRAHSNYFYSEVLGPEYTGKTSEVSCFLTDETGDSSNTMYCGSITIS